MRLSIGMCTYNGEKHLRDQLESFVKQARRPDELVVCDDRSTDGTWRILEEFRETAPFDVRIERNEKNLGTAANCARALSLCTGDVCFPSDQDDWWLPDKLAAFEKAFEGRPGVTLAISDVTVVDASLRASGFTIWEAHGFTPARQRLFLRDPLRVLFQANQSTAGAMAYRREINDIAFPVPKMWMHDGWIALVAMMRGEPAVVDTPAMLYRQHGNNQIGARRRSTGERLRLKAKRALSNPKDTFARDAQYWGSALERLRALGGPPERMAAIAEHEDHMEHLRARTHLPAGVARIPAVLREARTGRYRRYSGGVGSIIKDVVYG